MLKTVKDACTLHESTLEYQVSGGVENLLQIIHSSDKGRDFFARSYMTAGMEDLLAQGLLRLAGQSGQAVYELAQAMGGGKSHLMAALGLTAKYPDLRSSVVPLDVLERLDGQPARVAVFDGRNSPDHYLWGELAEQLGKEDAMRPFWEHGPKAPGKEDWKSIIGDQPALLLFDELPPYFLEARTVSVGRGTLADVLTRALSNLFMAAMELPRCCIVLANLTDTYRDQVKEIRRLVADVHREVRRQARIITPVSMEGNEIYEILKKRLFADLPSIQDIDEVAEAYADQIKAAEDSGYLTARSLEQVAEEVRSTYPFHPSFKHLVALFRDNPDFRETRGLLQFAARAIRSVWLRPGNDVYLIGTQHLNLNDKLVANEISNINRALTSAVAKDIADNGNAHAELVDAELNSDAGSQVAAMILSASLSLAVRGHMGLRREEVIEYLAAPNRKPEEFARAFDFVRKSAWYLHSEGDLFFFKDTENLIKRVQKEAASLARGKVEKALKNRLEAELDADSRLAYQQVLVMPEIGDISLSSCRVLVVVPPDNRIPPEDIERFYRSLAEKNHLLVLSGNDTHMAGRVEETLRELYAVERILKSIRPGDPLFEQAREMKEQNEESFIQALQGAFNRLYYPGEDGLQAATIENGLNFRPDVENNVEKQIEKMLASMRCDNKLALDALEDPIPYFSMAENDLWPTSDRRTPWRDILMRAKSNPAWPWLPGMKGLEKLKDQAVAQGRWREGTDGYIEKGPFPKSKTSLNIVRQSIDEKTGEAQLTLNPKDAGPSPRVYYSTKPQVSESDHVVEDLETFRTDYPTVYFKVVDTTGEHESGEPVRWVAEIKIKHQVRETPDHRQVELKTIPLADEIRYTLDGTNPREGIVYQDMFAIPDDKVLLQVRATAGEASAQHTFTIASRGQERPEIKDEKPARLVSQKVRLDSTDKVFDLITRFRDRQDISFQGVILYVGEGESAVQVRFNDRTVNPQMLGKVISSLRDSLGESDALVQMNIRDGASFGTGFDLKEFAELAGINLTPDKVEQ
ncbi:anti-phage-associated DUF499 domain-containing protein [Desulfonatronovibrio magnus]|uniref:anti-phage-associated DUF499 domain-containing protein n=1 Tax=Desulfonatronovibrio magnus TaxID=698827 RepID=UPI0005EADF13|nr:anti-phage-associated DUF499 domain-containing protein [Desulfonatronovibrio magnus]